MEVGKRVVDARTASRSTPAGVTPARATVRGERSPIRLTAAAIDRRLRRERAGDRGPRTADGVAMRLGREIARRRRLRGMTQEALAAAVACDRSLVCRWERGQRTPTLPRLLVLARALGCDAGALLADPPHQRERPDPTADAQAGDLGRGRLGRGRLLARRDGPAVLAEG